MIGHTTCVRAVPGVPIVALRAWLPGGTRLEQRPGEALVTGRLLAEGTEGRDWRRIAHEAEDRGMALEAFGSYESIGVSIDALASDLDQAMDWLVELIDTPSFPDDRCRWTRRQAAAELESALDQPDTRTAHAFAHQLYHPHPYGRPLHGSTSSLDTLDAATCRAAHRRARAAGSLMVITGALDETRVAARLEARRSTPSNETPATEAEHVPAPDARTDDRQVLDVGPGDQAHVFLGHLTVARAHPDRPALDLAAVALGAGSGLGGRLTTRIREDEGLAYEVGVATTAGAGVDAGRLSVYAGTAPKTVERVESLIRDELRRLVDHGLDPQEVDDARAFLVGSQPFRLETARQWADHLADAAFYDLPVDPDWLVDRWRHLDRDDVNAAIRRHVDPERLRTTIGMPSAG